MLEQVTTRLLELSERGVCLRLLDWGGSGPLALLAHANGFCAGVWDPVALHLRRRFRVIAFDARGHGDSSKPPDSAYGWSTFAEDLIALAQVLVAELGLRRVGLGVGHSLGGAITLEAAAEQPELFERIALLDPVIIPPPDLIPMIPSRGNTLAEGARRRRSIWPSREAAAESWRKREIFADWDAHAFALYVWDGLRARVDGQVELKCPPEVEARVFEASDRLDAFAAAEKLQVPALLARAESGHLPAEIYERLSRAGSCFDLRVIDAGHLLPMIVPEQVAELLLEFAS